MSARRSPPSSALLAAQTPQKRAAFFRQGLRFHESAAGVVVQRVSGADLRRMLRPLMEARAAAAAAGRDPAAVRAREHNPAPGDVVHDALYAFDTLFAECRRKEVDLLASAEAVAEEYEVDGAAGHACLMLAWRTAYDPRRRAHDKPALVGAMTLHRFKRSDNFSTTAASLAPRDAATLAPYLDARRNVMYIDTLCAKGRGGVGRILAMHAMRYALQRKCTGLIALSFSSKPLAPGARPESYGVFEGLGFEVLVARASFRANLHGTWFFLPLHEARFASLLADAVDVCARRGFTARTQDTLVWRCPA